MKNWVTLGFLYNFNPTLYNYIKFKFYHFQFCSKDDPAITASLYPDDLNDKLENEIAEEKSVNKKSSLAVIKKVIENQEAKQEMVALFEREGTDLINEEIKQFLNRVRNLIHNTSIESVQPPEKEEYATTADFPVRTYVIATPIYLEINNNELNYETLIRDTTALKEFIASKFKASKISGCITDMKNFSYKKILLGKNSEGAKGQLKPQLKQIASNPFFGNDVSAFAADILKAHYGSKG